ncbi:syncytin-A-like isoform X1 [Taeniopygia guttata]|uniref:syncytin-A-like isoform X1 n=1 Tax=Taeniopygia guttata TaxID=59729 RepID=UPI003BB8FC69
MAEFKTWTRAQINLNSTLGAQAVAFVQNLKFTDDSLQEFDLLGSVPGNYCLIFGSYATKPTQENGKLTDDDTWLSPRSPLYYNYSEYCNNSTQSVTPPRGGAGKLPPGTFLICGDRAWSAVPQNARGGPCYIGRLTLFAPTIHQVLELPQKTQQAKRSVLQMDPNCTDIVSLWGRASVVVASLFAPGVASSKALTQLRTLACWTGKQINITSKLISELAADVDDTRHAVLQNRAAIDFLLLAQRHGCEEFEGMCCMNLSDHSQSIYKQLTQLKDNMKKLTVVDTPFDNWLNSLGFSGWVKDLIRFGIVLLFIFIVILIVIPCFLQCVQKLVSRAFTSAWVAQKEKEGIVAAFLRERGHEL